MSGPVRSVRTGLADFAVEIPSGAVAVYLNGSAQSSLVVSSTLSPYPDAVLSVERGLPAGMSLTFPNPLVLPTLSETAVPVEISAVNGVAPGLYNVEIVASGGGVEETLPRAIQVTEAYWVLMVTDGRNFSSDGTPAVTVAGRQSW